MRTLSLLLFLFLFAACSDAPDAAPEATPDTPTTTTPDAAQAPAKLNLNTASGDAFLAIPDVDDRMVHEFEEYRPYTSIEQFRQEMAKYVDAEQIAAYEQYVFVPVSPNESDAATLQQLPGVDAQEAEALVAGRPYASDEAFLEALAGYVTDEERAAAAAYLAE